MSGDRWRVPLRIVLAYLPAPDPDPDRYVFRCPVCDTGSANPDDRRNGYCARCRDWTAPPDPDGADAWTARHRPETPR